MKFILLFHLLCVFASWNPAFAADAFETKDLAAGKPGVVKDLVAKIEAWKATLPEQPTGDVFSQDRQK